MLNILPPLAEIETAFAAVAAFAADPDACFPSPAPVHHLPAAVLPPLPAARHSIDFIPDGPNQWLVGINAKRSYTQYLVNEFAADGGRGFHFAKHYGSGTDKTAESYDVFLADPIAADAAGVHDSCDCRGFQRHGHCKHHGAAQAIADRNVPQCVRSAPRPANTARDLANDAAYRF
jgi:hypothetical protein